MLVQNKSVAIAALITDLFAVFRKKFARTPSCTIVEKNEHNIYENIFQNCRGIRMALPQATETRCRNGSVQARHIVQRLHKKHQIYTSSLLYYAVPSNLIA